jgi:predicted small secreted protein
MAAGAGKGSASRLINGRRGDKSPASAPGAPAEWSQKMRNVLVVAAVLSALALGACNTIAGAGRDVSAAGHAVTRTAKDVSR